MANSCVMNHSTEKAEKAEKTECPNCKGFGRIFGEEEECFLCNGYGDVWTSIKATGWTRAMYSRIESSQLY